MKKLGDGLGNDENSQTFSASDSFVLNEKLDIGLWKYNVIPCKNFGDLYFRVTTFTPEDIKDFTLLRAERKDSPRTDNIARFKIENGRPCLNANERLDRYILEEDSDGARKLTDDDEVHVEQSDTIFIDFDPKTKRFMMLIQKSPAINTVIYE